jgi:hypothetical protein
MSLHSLSKTTSLTALLKSYIATNGQPASLSWNKAPIWGLRPDLCFCLTFAGLFMWGALSDERTGLSFTISAGPRQRIHYGSESCGTRDHILLSLFRDYRIRRLIRLAGLRWRYSTPPPQGVLPGSGLLLLIKVRGGPTTNTPLNIAFALLFVFVSAEIYFNKTVVEIDTQKFTTLTCVFVAAETYLTRRCLAIDFSTLPLYIKILYL